VCVVDVYSDQLIPRRKLTLAGDLHLLHLSQGPATYKPTVLKAAWRGINGFREKNSPDKAKPGARPTAKYFHYSLMKGKFHI
jgi:hypothetical protein